MIKELEAQKKYLEENGQEFIDEWVLRLNERIEAKKDHDAKTGNLSMKENLIQLRDSLLENPEKHIQELLSQIEEWLPK